jgi:hypothetical protein
MTQGAVQFFVLGSSRKLNSYVTYGLTCKQPNIETFPAARMQEDSGSYWRERRMKARREQRWPEADKRFEVFVPVSGNRICLTHMPAPDTTPSARNCDGRPCGHVIT